MPVFGGACRKEGGNFSRIPYLLMRASTDLTSCGTNVDIAQKLGMWLKNKQNEQASLHF
jgi:hypothetical protein